jgi:hypothetical protein
MRRVRGAFAAVADSSWRCVCQAQPNPKHHVIPAFAGMTPRVGKGAPGPYSSSSSRGAACMPRAAI